MKKLVKYTGICSLLLNLMPFIIYLSIIKPGKEMLTEALPFAIYYGVRHSSLLLFRDFEYNTWRLGWIGIFSGGCGYALGMLGGYNSLFFDLSGIGAGIASTLFPAAINQQNRLIKNELLPKRDHVKAWGQLLILLFFFGIMVWIKQPAVKFGVMMLVTIFTGAAYRYAPHSVGHPLPRRLHWFNYVLALILISAMLMLRLGRNAGIGQPVGWGLLLLFIFFLTMVGGIILNRQKMLHYRHHLRLRLMLYGVCGQYWTLYSTIFISVLYGLKMYYWTIVAYLFAFIVGGLVVKKTCQLMPGDDQLVSLIMITLGIGLTFWLPSYFVGVFIIRSFASAERKNATAEYEQVTHNYSISYIISNYYYSITGLISQFVMWGSLFLAAGLTGMNNILGAYTLGRVSLQNSVAINVAHAVLAIYMITYIVLLAIKLVHDKKAGEA
ncbi:hypothetical protein [Limosilactobacillus caccae]|uniref:hypothetical protein n=1 Tax=Limosilactobacillus caccae TaxID=1926284 RepID=UPI0009707FE4|nr:hypothetical protein [Limosilactobacillus caccae]